MPGSFVDHWVAEYWHPGDERWVRVDPEVLGFEYVPTPEDLSDDEFLTGGEAWTWGIAEVRGNAIRDLAALNKVEVLPWDEWGRMRASYEDRTGPDYDVLLDTVAATCASDDVAAVERLYATDELAVPGSMLV